MVGGTPFQLTSTGMKLLNNGNTSVSPKGGRGAQHPLFTVFTQHRIVAMYAPRHIASRCSIPPSFLILGTPKCPSFIIH